MTEQLDLCVAMRNIHYIFRDQTVARIGSQRMLKCQVVLDATRYIGVKRVRQPFYGVFFEVIQGKTTLKLLVILANAEIGKAFLRSA